MWWKSRRSRQFERLMLPLMPAAYRMAYAIVHNRDDAADIVQEAYLRAFAAFSQFRGGSAAGWLLAIVRNAALRNLRNRCRQSNVVPFDPTLQGLATVGSEPSPETMAALRGDLRRVQRALDELPSVFREVLLLREVEGLSYQEIATVMCVPAGTVMSRLHRAREQLRDALAEPDASEQRE